MSSSLAERADRSVAACQAFQVRPDVAPAFPMLGRGKQRRGCSFLLTGLWPVNALKRLE